MKPLTVQTSVQLTAEEISRFAKTKEQIERSYALQTPENVFKRALTRCRHWPTCSPATGLQYAYQLEFLIHEEMKR